MFDPVKEAPEELPSDKARGGWEAGGDPGEGRRRRTAPLDRRVMRSLRSREGQAIARQTNLDSAEMRGIHRTLMGLYLTELEIQADNRHQMHLDEEFYDGIQWDMEEEEAIRDLGMIPIVANVIATTVNWVLGSERRMRTDYKILPRRKDEGAQAQRKTEYLKFVSDANFLPFARSDAFAEAVKSGIGFLEDGVQDGEGDPLMSRQVSWRDLVWDSTGGKDLRDGRFMFRTKHVDLDILESLFPHRRAQLRAASIGNDVFPGGADSYGDDAMDSREQARTIGGAPLSTEADYDRPRVRVIEGWFRKPARVKVLARGEKPGGEFLGEVYDPMSRGHWNELSNGQAIVADRTIMRTYVAIMTAEDILHFQESPYRHNQFPFTPIWCYRRGATGQPYGMVRGLRTLQEDINRRLMKALAILSSNKVVMDEGALGENADLDQFAEEVSRVNAIIIKKKNHEIDLNVDRELAPAHLEIMSRSISMVQSVAGVTDENLGRSTNATSGLAIGRRQDQGQLSTAIIFDNLRYSTTKQGEIQLSLVEQFVDEQREFRVVSPRGVPDFKSVNSVDPETGDVLWEDDITATKADYVISEQAWAASMRQAQVAELMEMLTQLAPAAPQVALAVLDLVVESMDIAARDEVVKRIRSATGMPDPDATEPTPEEIAKAKAQKEAQDRAIRMEEATIAEKEASAVQKRAAAGEIDVRAGIARQDEVIRRLQAQIEALTAAQQAMAVPAAAPVADQFLNDAGFKTVPAEQADAADAAEEEAVLAAAAAEQEAMAAAQADQMPPDAASGAMPPQGA